MADRNLAGPQKLQVAAVSHVPENVLKPLEIDVILYESPASMDPHRNEEGALGSESRFRAKKTKRLDELRPLFDRPGGENPRGNEPKSLPVEAACKELRQQREVFLESFVAVQPDAEKR